MTPATPEEAEAESEATDDDETVVYEQRSLRLGRGPIDVEATSARRNGMNPGSFASKLVAHFGASPEKQFTIDELHATVAQGKTKRRLRSALFDLVRRNKVHRVRNGLYQALSGAREEAPSP